MEHSVVQAGGGGMLPQEFFFLLDLRLQSTTSYDFYGT